LGKWVTSRGWNPHGRKVKVEKAYNWLAAGRIAEQLRNKGYKVAIHEAKKDRLYEIHYYRKSSQSTRKRKTQRKKTKRKRR